MRDVHLRSVEACTERAPGDPAPKEPVVARANGNARADGEGEGVRGKSHSSVVVPVDGTGAGRREEEKEEEYRLGYQGAEPNAAQTHKVSQIVPGTRVGDTGNNLGEREGAGEGVGQVEYAGNLWYRGKYTPGGGGRGRGGRLRVADDAGSQQGEFARDGAAGVSGSREGGRGVRRGRPRGNGWKVRGGGEVVQGGREVVDHAVGKEARGIVDSPPPPRVGGGRESAIEAIEVVPVTKVEIGRDGEVWGGVGGIGGGSEAMTSQTKVGRHTASGGGGSGHDGGSGVQLVVDGSEVQGVVGGRSDVQGVVQVEIFKSQ